MITVTKGQWFPLTIGNISYAGAAFDLQGATEVSASLVSTLGVKSPLSFEITAYNEISAVCDGSLSAGKYGIEVSCKGVDGKAYRMKSPGAIIEVSSSTTSSTGSTSVRVTGDEWELTADVEMHEGQARTYMSLLEEVRQGAVMATEEATDAASAVNAAKAACEMATKNATAATDKANTAAGKANDATAAATKAEQARAAAETDRVKADTAREQAEQERVTAEDARKTAESSRAQSEQSREAAETDRANAEKARTAAETQRKDAESQRETAFDSAKGACEMATKNATAATDKANTATEDANSAERGRVEAERGRVEAEQARVEAETNRVTAETEREQGFTEKSAHLEELLQYIKDNHLETDAKLAEAIKNTITGTDEFVYLDANDGNVKSMPNTNQLGENVAAVYYAGKRSINPGTNYMMVGWGNKLIRSIDLSGWDFKAATDMTYFMSAASNLKTLTLPDNMTLENVTRMVRSFRICSSLQSLDTSKWTLENVTDISYCFDGCSSLQSLDTSKWTLENVTNISYCFNGCYNLQSLDTSKWTLENVTNISYCFYGCYNLREIDLSSCNIMKCINWNNWIFNCQNLDTLRIGLIDFSLCGNVDFLSGANIRELTGTLRGIKNNFTAKSTRMTRDSCMVVINGLETVTEAKTLTLGANNKPVSLGGKGNDPISDDDLKVATDKGWTVQFA